MIGVVHFQFSVRIFRFRHISLSKLFWEFSDPEDLQYKILATSHSFGIYYAEYDVNCE